MDAVLAPPTYHGSGIAPRGWHIRALSVRTENAKMPSVGLNDANGEGQELVSPVKDLELLAAGAKHLLVASTKELLEPAQSRSLRPAP